MKKIVLDFLLWFAVPILFALFLQAMYGAVDLMVVRRHNMYGINMFGVAMEAAKGTEEFVEMLSELDMGIGMVRVMGCGFIVVAVMEIFTGISAVRFSNRVDRANKR